MDAWAESTAAFPALSSAPFSAAKSAILKNADPLWALLLLVKKAVQSDLGLALPGAESAVKAKRQLIVAACDGDIASIEALVRENPAVVTLSFAEIAGYPLLVFAVVFDHYATADALLSRYHVDPDEHDTAGPHYTPLMWAVHFENVAMVKLLLEYQADPYLAPNNDGKNAVLLVDPALGAIYDYFKSHNLLAPAADFYDDPATSSAFPDPLAHSGYSDPEMAPLHAQMQALSVQTQNAQLDEELELARDAELVQQPTFDYDKLLAGQYIKFSDLDIPSLLDYIFGLRAVPAHQHATKIPAAVLYQLMRYSHNKVDSAELTDFLFDCFVARLRSVTNTKSGVFNMAVSDGDKTAVGGGDIVLLSYWLSVLQYLHFYFTKGKLYAAYARYLQELVNLTQSLVATLSFSINLRLNLLVDDCIINYTSLVDVSSVLYAKDWNLFKNKSKKHPSTYDDILDMLYPPKELELMRPSPIRYVQVLGALDYVLKLHAVDPLLQFQTYSQVFYCINATIFNRIIASSKNTSRAKAVQIRLNLSALEDWLRSRNHHIYRPDRVGGLVSLLAPEKRATPLKNVLLEEDDAKDAHTLSFLYKSLYYVGRTNLMPTIELLQWLQVMSAIGDQEALVNTINEFDYLNYYQIYKVAYNLYRYEVEEKKLPKPLVQYLKRLMNDQGENQVSRSTLHYMTQSTFLLKELYIYLNPNYVFGVALPNYDELIVAFGSGIGGIRLLRAKKFQPLLPLLVQDDVDEILAQNKDNVNETYDYDDDDDNTNNDAHESDDDSDAGEKYPQKTFKGDELFKPMEPPLSLAHKEWGADDIESNPW